MVFIRAHVRNGVIVPDQPMALEPDSQVVVLVESAVWARWRTWSGRRASITSMPMMTMTGGAKD